MRCSAFGGGALHYGPRASGAGVRNWNLCWLSVGVASCCVALALFHARCFVFTDTGYLALADWVCNFPDWALTGVPFS